MGTQDVNRKQDTAALRRFTRHLIQDMRALEYMLEKGMFETDVRRIGAEQELFLVDERWQPFSVAERILERNTDPRLVNELTRFNLEFNLNPAVFEGTCLRDLEAQVNEMLTYVRGLAEAEEAQIVMCGILPTIHLSDLTLDNMVPKPRYFALNEAVMGGRNHMAQYQIRGVDELFFKHDNIMVEGCNTSFQTHFQVTPEEFPRFYNIAQLIAAPCLAAAANSPILFGKRLWRETRIAVFQQAVDTRSSNLYLRDMSPRVHFGTRWVENSVTELYQEDIARFRVWLTTEHEDPFKVLESGRIPKLQALQLHNGTVYRWNRACYGITDGKPHLRIENRILPSGPTVVDEVANATFWFGLVLGIANAYGDITQLISFDDALSNFISAARQGLGSDLMWLDGQRVSTPDLICDTLLPLARKGLQSANIDADDIDRYLGVLQARVESKSNGAEWQLRSITKLKKIESTRAERLNALVASTMQLQEKGEPVHLWPLADLIDEETRERLYGTRVEHYMSTDLFTVHEDELVEFVACLMDWRRIRRVLVENHDHELVGLVTHRNLLRYMANHDLNQLAQLDLPVKDIMIRDPYTVTPETSIIEGIRLMRKHKIGSLPVVQGKQLVGIVTERDFFRIAGQILEEHLLEEE